MDVAIKLHNLFDRFAFLKFCDCFFLNLIKDTSTARITEELVMRPTAQSPFLTASMAYYTWKRCPLGEKTVIAVSYI